jgi:hypothetical protein
MSDEALTWQIGVWNGIQCDIVRFQQAAGSVTGQPPVSDAGPGALADPRLYVAR